MKNAMVAMQTIGVTGQRQRGHDDTGDGRSHNGHQIEDCDEDTQQQRVGDAERDEPDEGRRAGNHRNQHIAKHVGTDLGETTSPMRMARGRRVWGTSRYSAVRIRGISTTKYTVNTITIRESASTPKTAVPALTTSLTAEPPEPLIVSVIRCWRWNRSFSLPMADEWPGPAGDIAAPGERSHRPVGQAAGSRTPQTRPLRRGRR